MNENNGRSGVGLQPCSATNVGTRVVPISPQAQDGLYTSASLDERKHELIVKVINHASAARKTEIRLSTKDLTEPIKLTTLQSSDLNAENTFDQPKNVSPQTLSATINAGTISAELPAYSVNVYRVPMR